MKLAKTVLLWIVAVVLALSFVPTGIGKFTDAGWREVFASWGYPVVLVYVVGIVEVLAGLLLLWPRTSAWAAATLVVTMSGALLTHLIHGNHPEFPAAQMAGIYLVLAALVVWGRWQQRLGAPTPTPTP